MGKRPYYIISYTRDYEGYETVIEYIGTNYKAALNRYIKLIEYIKQRDFLDEHVEEDRIEQRVQLPEGELTPGHSVYSYKDSFSRIQRQQPSFPERDQLNPEAGMCI